jgi:hypothetical protein
VSETQVSLLFFIFAVTALLAQLADAWYTESGLKKGLVEGNPWNKFLFSKMSVAAATFIDYSVFIVVATVLFKLAPLAGIFMGAAVTVSETIMALRNKKMAGL